MCALRTISLGIVLLGYAAPGEARPAWEQETHPDQQEIEALRKLALQEGESGNSVEAIRDYQRALDLQPDWREGRWNLGTLQYGANRYAEAATTFRKVVGFAAELGIAWALLGLSEFEIRSFTDSLAHLEKAHSLGIKGDPETQRIAVYHLCLLLIRSGAFDRATELLLANFAASPAGRPSTSQTSSQVNIALGLAMLRVPLLPEEVDPSQEALLQTAGSVMLSENEMPQRCEALLRSYPDVPYAHYACAMALAASGSNKEAMRLLHDETLLSPGSPLPWAELSRIEHRLGDAKEADADSAKARGLELHLTSIDRDPEQRIVLRYKSAGARRPGSVAVEDDSQLWSRAMEAYSTHQPSEAAADLKEWLRRNPDRSTPATGTPNNGTPNTGTPNNGTPWAMLGLCEFALEDFDNALIHLERGQQLGLRGSPESIQSAKYTFGILLIRASQFDRASEVLAYARTAGQLDAQVGFALGLAMLRIPELPSQLDRQQNGIVSAAGTVAALLLDSKYDDAFPVLKKLIAQHPSTPFLHYTYGTALIALSQFDEAAEQMLAEIVISPASELPLVRLASIRLREHHPVEAVRWAQQALRMAPNSADAHYLLGRAALESGDTATAVQQLEIAGNLSPGSPEVHFNLAKAYTRAQMPAQAAREREIFSRLNEIAEVQRGHRGSQSYAGPHDAADVSAPQL